MEEPKSHAGNCMLDCLVSGRWTDDELLAAIEGELNWAISAVSNTILPPGTASAMPILLTDFKITYRATSCAPPRTRQSRVKLPILSHLDASLTGAQ